MILRRWAHTLRPYQSECIDKCLQSLEQGIRRQAVSLPVGSGKTVIFSNLIRRIPPPSPIASKVLVLAHREELLVQAATQIQRASPDLIVDIDQGRRVANPAADVIVASVPTLGRSHSDRLLKYDPMRFKCLIIDEAHHAAAESYSKIIEHFDRTGDLVVWGCSATLHRYDGLKLTKAFDKIVYQKHFIQMIKDKWLCGMRIVTVKTCSTIDRVRKLNGDFATSSLSSAVNNDERNLAVVKAYDKYARKRSSTLVFAVDVKHAVSLRDEFRAFGIHAEAVLGKTSIAERERILADFRNRKLPVLVNCGILTEGTDIPNIDCVMMARPTRSPVLFQQMIGRGMRLSPGKTDCLIVDFVDSFGGELVQITVPTLMGLDPALALSETDIVDKESLARQQSLFIEQRPPPEPIVDPHLQAEMRMLKRFEEQENAALKELPRSLESIGFRATEHLNPLQLFSMQSTLPSYGAAASRGIEYEVVSSGSSNIRKLSMLSWVCISPTRYLLSNRNTLYFITLDQESGLWKGSRRTQMKTIPVSNGKGKNHGGQFLTKETPIDLESPTLQHAVRAIDSMARSKLPPFEYQILLWNAPWRRKPATESQIRMLNRLGLRVSIDAPCQVKKLVDEIKGAPESNAKDKQSPKALIGTLLTRGTATNIILRITHGATKTWRDVCAAREKMEKAKLAAEDPVLSAANALWVS
ncbi:DEAD DEAH box helicase [Coemansia sp. RSA 1722]|nr:DEAD DEAH box helicase [Coemansia sp. RSA 486]KAJ2235858.1 putative ATP-dependent helicase IRC3 [Coemansia sp. RSA 485]KAJ2594609.1 DEAD DEAH box helicase [Coemansia sp. RSA 1722]